MMFGRRRGISGYGYYGYPGDFVEQEIIREEIIDDEVYGGYGVGLGIDPFNGDPVLEGPGGFGIDLDNGDLTIDEGPFGFDL
jgi:hypothetical protein